ncbi:MAG TPA: RNA-binding protein [Roseiarcus sp.]|nr:RNA-binding protein [Roseiarcus sp.]
MSAPGADGGSERTCIVTGVKDAPEAMLRFALSPEGTVVPDIRRKLPGRGVWTRLSSEAVRRAAKKDAFSRAFRAKAQASPELADAVDALLEKDALQSLAMANKAGLVVAGAVKVDLAIEAGNVAALIEATDGAPNSAAKRVRAFGAKLGRAGTIPVVNLFSSSQLGLALGKANVIHAALKSGAATTAFLARAERARRYRASEADADITTESGVAPAGGGAVLGQTEKSADSPCD